ncbi:M16 family metallopeptidase [Streptomyces sp. IBSBF 2806]|uniref:M16 family metallopeptidase n=1 Tax=Streptomyces sp. IBSBF 2806 TaxID=2903529 RepID=UPI002FDC6813
MADAPWNAELLRVCLPNGLRVLLAPSPGLPRVAVCVTYAVGFRSEQPGQEGLAHLFEHLMFRGSESLPAGQFYDHVHRMAAQANGTTHQDYTDYYQVVPATALEAALFSEADRMRAPCFTQKELSQQLDGVATEIKQRTLDRPLGDLPWPLLPQALYRSHRNAHDGLGAIDQLKETTLEDCAAFFHTHYAPGNAVLTLTGGFEPQQALALIERHFGDIPGRPTPAQAHLDEGPAETDEWLRCGEPGIPSPVVAVGYRLAAPDHDLHGYLTHVLLARLLGTDPFQPELGGTVRVSASCGFFGPLDARTPDALILAGMLPQDLAPELFITAIRRALARYAGGDLDPARWRSAVRGLAIEHHRSHGDLQTRCRALGRFEILFNRAQLLDEIPLALDSLRQEEAETAARTLVTARHGVVVMDPAGTRHRPRPATTRREAVPAPTPHPSALQLASTKKGPRPRPPVAPPSGATFSSSHTQILPTGLRLILVEDRRSPSVAEVRMRIPMGAAALLAPDAVAKRVHAAWTPEPQGDKGLGSWSAHISEDGQWLDTAAHLPVDELPTVLETLISRAMDSLPVERGSGPDSVSALHDSHQWLMAQALARHALQRAGREGSLPGAGLAGGCLAITAPLPAAKVLDSLGPTLLSTVAQDRPREGLPADITWQPSDLIHATHASPGQTSILLCSSENGRPVHEAARYLATAVFGGYHRSRLASAASQQSLTITELLAGRDTFLGQRRAWVRARVPNYEAERLVTVVRSEASRLARRPPSAMEVKQAAEFCAAQMTAVFDSPASLADALARLGSTGWTPSDLAQFPRRLWQTSAEEVEQAAESLFARGLRGGIVLAGA